jgi:hypothetical protein
MPRNALPFRIPPARNPSDRRILPTSGRADGVIVIGLGVTPTEDVPGGLYLALNEFGTRVNSGVTMESGSSR